MLRMAPPPTFDKATGQVFTETTTGMTSMLDTCFTDRTLLSHTKEEVKDSLGAPSLVHRALDQICSTIDEITPAHLELLPWVIAEKIARRAVERGKLTVEAWIAFSTAYPNDFKEDREFRVRHGNPSSDCLPKIIHRLSATTYSTLTHLCVLHVQLTADDLLAIAKIQCVEVLALEQAHYDELIDDFFMRKWCRLIHEGNYMSQLRVLILRQFGLTIESLKHLKQLPASLTLCNLKGKRMRINLRNFEELRKRGAIQGWCKESKELEISWLMNNHDTKVKMNALVAKVTTDRKPVLSINYYNLLHSHAHYATSETSKPKGCSGWFRRTTTEDPELGGVKESKTSREQMRQDGVGVEDHDGNEAEFDGPPRKRNKRKKSNVQQRMARKERRTKDLGEIFGDFGIGR